MYKVNDYIKHKKEVCRINKIMENYHNGVDYYELVPISDETLNIKIPVNSPNLKALMSKKEVEELIKKIPSIPLIESKSRLIENEYKELINSDNYEDLIRIIKTTFIRNKERMDNHKRVGDKDNFYFNLAIDYLYYEFAVVLGKTFDEVKECVNSMLV